jgi:hypothetical protein
LTSFTDPFKLATNPGENLIADIIATRPPEEVVEPAGRNSFAVPGDLKADTEKALSAEITAAFDEDKYPVPTEEENKTLRKVAENLPIVSYALCLVEFAERASYYGAQTVFSNFVEFPLPAGEFLTLSICLGCRLTSEIGGNGAGAPPRGTQEMAGALGMGLQASSGLVLLFTFLAYFVPIFGGWWADVKVGRYYAIVVGVLICGVAHIIQIVGAIPAVL